jgi:hypothetical protein
MEAGRRLFCFFRVEKNEHPAESGKVGVTRPRSSRKLGGGTALGFPKDGPHECPRPEIRIPREKVTRPAARCQ